MVDTLNTLWELFKIIAVCFLIFTVSYAFIGTIYNLLIGKKKEEKRKEKAREDLLNSLQELAKELGSCECEKETKKRTTKSRKKEN